MRPYQSILLLLVSLLSINSIEAQSPVTWTFTSEYLGNDEFNLIATADIKDGWYTYSQQRAEDGPVPTTFEFYEEDHYKLLGTAVESGNRKSAPEPAFGGIEVIKFSQKGIFTQKVKVTDASKPISGYVNYMTCDGELCLPPKDVDFEFTVEVPKNIVVEPIAEEVAEIEEEVVEKTQEITPVEIKEEVSEIVESTPVTTPAKKTPKVQTAPVKVDQSKRAAPVFKDVGHQAEERKSFANDGKATHDEPVIFEYTKEKISDNEYDLIVHIDIADGFSVYSAYLSEDASPEPTTLEFFEAKFYDLKGKLTESDNVKTKYDKVFAEDISKFNDYATFRQRIVLNEPNGIVKGYITGMYCDDHGCRQFNNDLSYVFGEPATGTSNVIGATGNQANEHTVGTFDSKRSIAHETYQSDCGTVEEKSDSIWWILFQGFLGGFIALLTPCVFPMIPLTVSFFTGRGTDQAGGIRKALIYGVSIIVIYVVLGTILTTIFGPTILNRMSVDPYFNVFFFLMLVAFALSFFGLFELTLPSSWVNSADKAADKGGLIGIFFMAGTLALVSFSCTGPIIGTLLVNAVKETSEASLAFGFIPIRPVAGMFGFALALALPFTLFAMFPSWLNSLPKSGSWMNNVKVTLGFLELAFAFKFLSIADMVRHWGILKYELFMAIWIILFLGLALYQFGFIKFHGEKLSGKLGIGRSLVGTLSLVFSGWMAVALFNYAPMPVASGLAPPAHYNFFRPMDCPYGLDCFKDFDEAVAKAKEENKPLFVDFTGYGCVNCRDVEENVWVDQEIQSKLREDFVVVSLYVDDQKRLFPDDKRKHLLDKYTKERLRTVGSKWASFEVNNFEISSQPYYVLMDNDGERLLNKPIAYTRDIEAYNAFLECGLTAFRGLAQR